MHGSISTPHRATTPASDATSWGAAAPRVYVASPVRLFREMLAASLEHAGGLRACGSGGLADVQTAVDQLAPDVLLLDVTAGESLVVTRRAMQARPALRVVAFAVAEEDSRLLACARAGVFGYVAHDGSVADVVDAVRRTGSGERVCPPRLVALILARVAGHAGGEPAAEEPRLTAREHEIATLLAGGLSNKHIARQLSLAHATVKNHVHKILEKLHLQRRGEVASQYLGLTTGLHDRPGATHARRLDAA